ncbi:MerR-like helix-turn-helix DNA binding protein [Microbacterium phage Triscuit]|nr:MerR-like helix-turn-helix DNA binding protein [Microbacterium phage Triscuit]AVR56985.1 MerR-like helix-turn-helix DNA binding protein [Microbacterium phage Triscuit]
MAAEKTFTIQEIADKIDVNARTIRKVLRANIEKDAQPGRGARWMIRESQIGKLTEMVNAFNARAAVVPDLGE